MARLRQGGRHCFFNGRLQLTTGTFNDPATGTGSWEAVRRRDVTAAAATGRQPGLVQLLDLHFVIGMNESPSKIIVRRLPLVRLL